MNKDINIAIIGGGIGGLTTALCLEYYGFKNYTIYEQAKEFKEVGAAISLWPNALHVYKEIDIYDDLTTKWGEMKSGYIKTDTGEILTHTKPKYDLPLVCIHRADLHSTLLKKIPQERLIPFHKLEKITQRSGITKILFKNGIEIEPDIIIGADGINSTVRKYIINDGSPIYRGYNIWRGIATLKDTPSGYSSETWGNGKRVGIVPIKDNKFGWWATINENENITETPQEMLKKLTEQFGNWHEPIPQLFESSAEIIKNKIGDRIPTKGWSKDNLVLLGDAAHPTTPNLGQGACMAIEGAFILSKCFAHFDDYSKAFKQYENLHYKRSAEIVKQSLQNGKMGQLENIIAVKSRNLLIKSMPPKLAMKMLDKFFGYNVTKIDITKG